MQSATLRAVAGPVGELGSVVECSTFLDTKHHAVVQCRRFRIHEDRAFVVMSIAGATIDRKIYAERIAVAYQGATGCYTFLSDGWCCRVRPSSSHFTSASSSFVFSTVPNSPVGLPKSAKPIHDLRGSVLRREQRAERAVVSSRGLRRQLLRRVIEVVAELCAVRVSAFWCYTS
jgi:hypothetical protein